MSHESFVSLPFVDVTAEEVQVRLFTPKDGGDPGVVLYLASGLSIQVYDRAVIDRLVQVTVEGQALLVAALTHQDALPVDTRAGIPAARAVIAAHASAGVP